LKIADAGFRILVLLAVGLLLFVGGCTKSSPFLTVTDGLISEELYRNNYFFFSIPIPPNWTIADAQTDAMISEKIRNNLEEYDPDLIDETDSVGIGLLTISKYPLGTEASNPNIRISAEYVAQYHDLEDAEDYLETGVKLMHAALPYEPNHEIYEYDIDGKAFARTDMKLNTPNGLIYQSFITALSKKYSLSIVLSGQTDEEIEYLETIVHAGDFTNFSTQISKERERNVSPIQIALSITLLSIGLLWYVVKYLRRLREPTTISTSIEEGND